MSKIIHMDTEKVRAFYSHTTSQFDEMEEMLAETGKRIRAIPWEGGSRERFVSDYSRLAAQIKGNIDQGRIYLFQVQNEVDEWLEVDQSSANQYAQDRTDHLTWWKITLIAGQYIKLVSNLGDKFEMIKWWKTLNEEERIAFLQQQHEMIAKDLGIEPLTVQFGKAGEQGLAGGYEYLSNQLAIYEDVNSADPFAILETVAHETRHKFQDECINAWLVDGILPDGVNEATIREWQYEMNPDRYISSGDDLEGYWKQRIEEDARNYSEGYVDKILNERGYLSTHET